MEIIPIVEIVNDSAPAPPRRQRRRRVRIQEPAQPWLKRIWLKQRVNLLGLIIGVLIAFAIAVLMLSDLGLWDLL
jgi:hypothetical protein